MSMMFRKMLRDLRAMWAQTLALVVIMALGIAGYMGLVGAYRNLGSSYDKTYEQLRFADVTFETGLVPVSAETEIAALPGVSAVTGRLQIDSGLELGDESQLRARLIGIPTDGDPSVNGFAPIDGRTLAGEMGQVVMLEHAFAGHHGIEPGDMLNPLINGDPTAFEVLAVGATPEYLVVSPSKQDLIPSPRTFAVLFVPRDTLVDLTGTDAETPMNNIAVRLEAGADVDAVIDEIESILKPFSLRATTLRADHPSNSALRQDLEGFRSISRLMPTLIIIVAAISVYVLMGRMVRSQQPQIGLMKALGYGNRAVLTHYLTFALTIGVGGLLFGTLLGVPLAAVATQGYANELGIPLVETHFYPDLLLSGLILSTVAAFFAGLGPAWSSAKLTPAQAMYIDPATQLSAGKRTLLERVVRLPLSLRLPWRNVFRMRRRSLTTGLGIIFSFVLILMVLGLVDAMRGIMDGMFVSTERWDMTVVFESPQQLDVVEQVESWTGVDSAEPIIQLPATITNDDADEAILLTALDPAQQMHILHLIGDDEVSDVLTEGHVVLTESLASKLGLEIGDEVIFDTPLGEQRLVLSAVVEEFIAAAGYISMDEGQSMLPVPVEVINALYLTVDKSAEKRIKRDLYHLPSTAAVQVKTEMRDQMNDLLTLFWTMMTVMLTFVIIMSFALLFNAVTTNVLERERELATMRSIGTGKWHIGWLISAESILLWLITLLPGLALGTWVAIKMGEEMGSELFALKVVISPMTYAITAGGILLTMLLASIPAIRRVNRLNLASATKVLT